MPEELELKERLKSLIENEDIDYGAVLEAASELSEFDNQNVRFSVDANLVKRLGEQLVAKKTTALSELVKNSYDADATEVKVIFENTDSPGGRITVLDNGSGMTKEALVRGFMKISTSDKEDNSSSTLFERPRAGRKGIGRFSAHKVGRELTVVTRTAEDKPFNVIKIDWDKFKANVNLTTIASAIVETKDDIGKETFERFGFNTGTKLIISNTREAWSPENIVTAFKYTSQVIRIAPKALSSGVVDPGFAPTFFNRLPLDDELVPIVSDETEFLSEALAIIQASITDKGNLLINIQGMNSLSGMNESYEINDLKVQALLQTAFSFKAHYFPLGKGEKKPPHLQTYLRENGGVKLFRNGFYVPPYGGRHDDWLGLDDSSRRRLILNPHANTNFIGSIDIVDSEGLYFDETSSREGLLENEYFQDLQRVGYEIVKSAIKRISSERGRKVTSSQKNYVAPEKTLEDQLQQNLEMVAVRLDTLERDVLKDGSGNANKVNEASVKTEEVRQIRSALEEREEIIREIIDEKNMYRVLASSGLAIAEFTHEIQLYLNNLMLNSKHLSRLLKECQVPSDSVSDMRSNIEMLVSYTDFFTDTIRSNSQRKKQVIELRDVINSFVSAMSPTIERRGYDWKIDFQGDEFWTKPVHLSELSSILMNLFTNSCKAIVRAGKSKGVLLLEVKANSDDIVLRFEDNGDGIPRKDWGRVFNALFTTEVSQGAFAIESQQLRGMGLGLAITRDIVEGFDGEVAVVEPSAGYMTCIEIVIPKAEESEVPDNAY